jgi:hypothetical protein
MQPFVIMQQRDTRYWATFRKKKGDLEAALTSYRQGHGILNDLKSADANNQQAILNLGLAEASIGEVLIRQGKAPKACTAFARRLLFCVRRRVPRTCGLILD